MGIHPTIHTVMFWNLHVVGFERKAGDDTRWNLQRDLIRQRRPSVLMAAEGWCWDLDDRALFEDAKRSLDMEGALFEAKTGCHQAIFWRHDVSLLESEAQWHELAQWHGYGSAVLRLPGRTEPIRFTVSHLDPYSPLSRGIESDRLRGFLGADPTTPTVLAMDANTVPPGDPEPDWSALPAHLLGNHVLPGGTEADRTPVERLLGSAHAPILTDVAAHLGDRRPTFAAPQEGDPPRRIDLFLASPGLLPHVVSYRVVSSPETDPANGPAASDHRPIEMDLAL
ncbi:endonuclease/exonuclease/phosphatase family metal-dependent hydrolase [Kitasatospora sp. MAP12-15]|uniref:endonuclease/exonuclease/phosphatase family protein n=1 Tax=unclassified Kitasatospora TaxID=2633591 RepID=UPI002476DE2E|nr:endonuclease/exonuclease/phosphatase family protein [Kitasatospora sp. MAP12-44]MDH6115447.1 endonuclease/exonuclease/phosphatase family metal-dependent hydrolase [Kitasatospora sp. MAP12-44]